MGGPPGLHGGADAGIRVVDGEAAAAQAAGKTVGMKFVRRLRTASTRTTGRATGKRLRGCSPGSGKTGVGEEGVALLTHPPMAEGPLESLSQAASTARASWRRIISRNARRAPEA